VIERKTHENRTTSQEPSMTVAINGIAHIYLTVAEYRGAIVHPPQEDDWAPGYYSVLFEDPCGTRLEVNHVPGRGNLADDVELPLAGETQARLSEP
jgi:hypothetical protein